MRITFGGGPRRGRRSRYGRSGIYVSIPLGPIGSMIVSVILMLSGIFTVIISMGSILPLIVGVIFILFGFFSFKSNYKQYQYNKKRRNREIEEEK